MNKWIQATRPKTLPAAIAPVILGTSIAISTNQFNPISATLCLLTAITLQIACNFSNDYSDGIKGTDKNRIGPQRLVASKHPKTSPNNSNHNLHHNYNIRNHTNPIHTKMGTNPNRNTINPSKLVLHRRKKPIRIQRLRRNKRIHILRTNSNNRHNIRTNKYYTSHINKHSIFNRNAFKRNASNK